MEQTAPNYELSEEEFHALESELVENLLDTIHGDEAMENNSGVYSVWLPPYSKFTNLLRTSEAGYFPEVKDLESGLEEKTKFLAIVDTRGGSGRVVHAATLSVFDVESDSETGFYTVDDLIEEGNFTKSQFVDFYTDKGIDLKKSLSVDTNFRIGERAPDVEGLKPSDIAYLTMFQALLREADGGSDCAIFASINQDSISSFERIGLEVKPLMGRTNLVTSESREGKDFYPVEIPLSEQNRQLFLAMNYKAPEIALT